MTKQISFTFNHEALNAGDNITVVKFNGDEGISKLFEFTIEMKSSNADLDIDAILESPASLEISLGDDVRKIQGIVSHFDAVRQINHETIYVATLVPRLWELSLYHTNEVYLEQTVSEIIETVLQEAGFTSLDYDVSGIEENDVTGKIWPYKCQYGETHLDFISRLMERDGIYYYFVEGDVGEKVVFCNSLNFQEAIIVPNVLYSPMSSLEINSLENTVNSFVSQQKRLPHKVLVKDYNDDKPSVDIKGEAIIDEKANKSSEIYVWGQNIETPEEGGVLAQIRAEEFLATKRTYHGESSVVRLLTGFNFTLKDHFRQTCNQEYLLLSISHEASNPSALDFSGGIGALPPVYSNSFSAIAADVQYRPEIITNKPEIHGTLNAFIDSEGDGQYAEVDEEGRYRVTMPFDRIDRDGGKASHYLRMSQPFSGENQGMHFPLRKGAEVLLTFIGGDPDRPVIAGSIPNASQPSVVNADNHTNSMIKTGAGNKIELEDKDGKNRIKLQTGDEKSYMHLGSPNHDGDGWVVVTNGIERKHITGGQRITMLADEGGQNATDSTDTSAGTNPSISVADQSDLNDLHEFTIKTNDGTDDKTENGAVMGKDQELSGKYLIERRAGDKYLWTDGDEFVYGGGNLFEYGNGYTEAHADDTGCDGSEFWPSKEDRLDVEPVIGITGNDAASKKPCPQDPKITKINSEISTIESEISTLNSEISKLSQEISQYRTNSQYVISKRNELSSKNTELAQKNGDLRNKKSALETLEAEKKKFYKKRSSLIAGDAAVEKTWTDTFTYNNGKNYEWGDTCDYAFGNGYEEAHADGTMEIDLKHSKDLIKGPGFNTVSGTKVTGLSEDTTWVSKSIGNAYDYVKGNSIEIVVGNCESHMHGNSYDYVVGNSVEEVKGNVKSTFDGNVVEDVNGNYDGKIIGAASEMFLGASNSMFLGAQNDMCLSIANNMYIGICTDISVALKLEVALGSTFTADMTTELNTKVVDVEATLNSLKTDVTALGAAVNVIKSGAVEIKTKGLSMESGGMKLIA